MRYKIKVGNKYLIGENYKETLNGTMRGDTTAVFNRNVGQLSAYDFADEADSAATFDRVTALGYVEGLFERQANGFYGGEIKMFDASQPETVAHCNIEENARIIGMIMDFDALGRRFDWYEQQQQVQAAD